MSNQSALATFGDRDDIREIGDRLQKMMPGTVSFTQSEALTVAQIAVAHGLDPFNGEVWGIKGNGKWYGVMVGIKGLRKSARRQILESNGSYWTEFRRAMPDEYDVTTKGAVVYECVIRDTETNGAWAQSVKALRDAEITYDDVIAMLGKAPSVKGVGIADPGERSKMELHARAKKRAEADAIKQRFDVEFAGTTYRPEFIDQEPEYVPAIEEVTQPARDSSEILKEMGYDVEDGEFAEVPDDGGPAWTNEPEDRSEYATVTDSKGVLYKDKDVSALSFSQKGLASMLTQFGEVTEENVEKYDNIKLKLEAVEHYITANS